MIRVEYIKTWGFEHAIRGMRNPMNSWEKSDSIVVSEGCEFCESYYLDCNDCFNDGGTCMHLGLNDLELMKKLANAGSSHRKFLRQIFISMDITAPLYWWKEFDTYKIGTTANSCSTMHTIHKKEFTLEDFSTEYLGDDVIKNPFLTVIDCLNFFRELYLQHKDKSDWYTMIQILPSSYNQKRTVTMNYENALNVITQRENHRLEEWQDFIKVLRGLPFMEQIT